MDLAKKCIKMTERHSNRLKKFLSYKRDQMFSAFGFCVHDLHSQKYVAAAFRKIIYTNLRRGPYFRGRQFNICSLVTDYNGLLIY